MAKLTRKRDREIIGAAISAWNEESVDTGRSFRECLTFKDFEDFASFDWPEAVPEDCTKFDVAETDADCFEIIKTGEFCPSCAEYRRRLDAWDHEKNEPKAEWWKLVTSQYGEDKESDDEQETL
jgi:hypothetical protein